MRARCSLLSAQCLLDLHLQIDVRWTVNQPFIIVLSNPSIHLAVWRLIARMRISQRGLYMLELWICFFAGTHTLSSPRLNDSPTCVVVVHLWYRAKSVLPAAFLLLFLLMRVLRPVIVRVTNYRKCMYCSNDEGVQLCNKIRI